MSPYNLLEQLCWVPLCSPEYVLAAPCRAARFTRGSSATWAAAAVPAATLPDAAAAVVAAVCLQACGADDELSEDDVEGGEVDSLAHRLTQLVQEVRCRGATAWGHSVG